MQTLIALHAQNPSMTWLAVGALFVALNLSTGFGRLIQPALGAAAVGGVCALGTRLGLAGEVMVFAGSTAACFCADRWMRRRRRETAPVTAAFEPATPEAPVQADLKTAAPSAPQAPFHLVRSGPTSDQLAQAFTEDGRESAPPRRAARL